MNLLHVSDGRRVLRNAGFPFLFFDLLLLLLNHRSEPHSHLHIYLWKVDLLIFPFLLLRLLAITGGKHQFSLPLLHCMAIL